jgi:hypothetical protein
MALIVARLLPSALHCGMFYAKERLQMPLHRRYVRAVVSCAYNTW